MLRLQYLNKGDPILTAAEKSKSGLVKYMNQGSVFLHCCWCLVITSCLTPCNPMEYSTTGFPVLHYLLEFDQTHVHWVGDAIQPSHSLLPSSTFAFNQGLIQWVASSHQVTKYWSFSFGISPSNEYSLLVSFRMDWFDLLAVQGTLKSLLQHHSSKASILQHSALFLVQLSHSCMTTGETIFDYIDLCQQSGVSVF